MPNAARLFVNDAPVIDNSSKMRPSLCDDARSIDLVHLSKQTFGERNLEAELLRLFDAQAEQIMVRLTDAPLRDAADTNWRADLSHTLTGSARAIGAFQVAKAAEAYETALRAGDDRQDLRLRLADSVAAARRTIADLLAG